MEAKRGLGKGEKDRRPPSERTEQKGGRRARTPQRGPGRVTGQSASRHLRALKRTGAPRAGLPEQHRFPPRPQIKPKRSTAPRSRSAEELDEAWRGFAAPLSGPGRRAARWAPGALTARCGSGSLPAGGGQLQEVPQKPPARGAALRRRGRPRGSAQPLRRWPLMGGRPEPSPPAERGSFGPGGVRGPGGRARSVALPLRQPPTAKTFLRPAEPKTNRVRRTPRPARPRASPRPSGARPRGSRGARLSPAPSFTFSAAAAIVTGNLPGVTAAALPGKGRGSEGGAVLSGAPTIGKARRPASEWTTAQAREADPRLRTALREAAAEDERPPSSGCGAQGSEGGRRGEGSGGLL